MGNDQHPLLLKPFHQQQGAFMRRKLQTLSLAILLTLAAVPVFAAAPSAQPSTQPATSTPLLDAILGSAVPATPASATSIVTPFYGYCTATCARCYSGNTPPCAPDPDTGLRQGCTRIPAC
jgi:hypothetical protein